MSIKARVACTCIHVEPWGAIARVEETPGSASRPYSPSGQGGRMKVRLTTRTRRALGIASGAALCLALIPVANYAFAAGNAAPAASSNHGEKVGNYDVRDDG